MEPQPQPKCKFPDAELDSTFSRAFKPFLEWLASPAFLCWLWGAISYLVSRLLGLLISLLGWIAAKLARIVIEAKDLGDPAYDELATAALKDMLGVDVGLIATKGRGQAEARKNISNAIGEKVMTGLFGAFAGGSPSQLKPSAEGAEKFIGTMTRMAFEGWLWGWLVELIGAGQLECFGELDDKMTAALGLGRLSRRVLAPPMGILVEQPFTWLLNRTYRPNLLGSAELIRQYIRGRATHERLFYEMSLAGYKDDDTEALLATHQKFLGDTDLLYLVERGTWTEAQAIEHLRDQGATEPIAKAMLAVERDRKIDAYRKQAAAAACEAFVSRDIEEAQLRTVLAELKLPVWEADWMRTVAGMKREFRVKDLSLGDLEQGVKRGILGLNDFRAACIKAGYSVTDARTLELLLMTEVRDKEAADAAKAAVALARELEKKRKAEEQAARRAAIEEELRVREVSLAQMEAMVRRGLRSVEQYRSFLRALKYAPEDVSALAELLEGQMEDARTEAERREELRAEAARRKISIADLERAVKLGLLSVDEYRSQLAAAGFGDEERDLLAHILQRELDLAAQAEAQREEARRRLAERQISLDDLERAVRLGQRTVAQYRARLEAEGFVADDADLMAELLRAEVAADQEARDRRAEIEARLKRKRISLSELEQAVRAGVRTMAEYRSVLLREGYSDADADMLVKLLQLQIDADKAAAATRKAAEARLAEQHISLADLERAVKLEVISVADYRAALKREGFTAEDQAVLVQLLTTELAAIRAAEKKRAAAEKAAAKHAISLADLERAVRLGLRSSVEYQAVLRELGYSAQDQATLMGLLQLQLAQDQAARQKRKEAETELVARGLSLSQWERAVLEGVRPVRAYAAWLLDQGYSREDAATLVALLQLELAARAARQPAPGP